MGQPAAARGDRVVGLDTHVVVIAGAAPAANTVPFDGPLTAGLSQDVRITGRPAAVVGSTAVNTPPHAVPGGTFVRPPTDQGVVEAGSPTVRINGKPAARHGDPVLTCNDPVDVAAGRIVATSPVRIG